MQNMNKHAVLTDYLCNLGERDISFALRRGISEIAGTLWGRDANLGRRVSVLKSVLFRHDGAHLRERFIEYDPLMREAFRLYDELERSEGKPVDRLYDGVDRFIENNHRLGLPVYILSNAIGDDVDRIRDTGIVNKVDGLITPEMFSSGTSDYVFKPDPRLFVQAADYLGLDFSQIAYFDNERRNAAVAHELGMAAVLHDRKQKYRGANLDFPVIESYGAFYHNLPHHFIRDDAA